MPEQSEPKPGIGETAAANAEIVAKLEAQGRDALPSLDDATSTALDALRSAKEAEATAPETDEPVVVEKKEAAAEPAPDATPEAVVAAKVESDKKAAEEAAGNKIFEGIELPPKASPRSAEAFASIKIKAAQELAKRDEEIATVKAKLEQLEKTQANPLTPELEKEIAELREFRAKLDIESDPKFKEFDRKSDGAAEFIYSRLKASGDLTDEQIKSIKGYGGPANIVMEKIFEKITDPALKRLIESKYTEIETIAFDKEQAIKKAKEDVKGYVAERSKENEQAGQTHQAATKAQLDGMMTNMKWLAPRKAEAGAKDEEKKAVENHNAFVTELNKEIGEALRDDSAQMRAVLIAGTAQLLYLQKVHAAATDKMAGLEKQLKEANEFIAKYKKAAGSGQRETAAPPSGKLPDTNKGPDLNTPVTQSIDDLAAKIVAERRARQVA